MNLIRYFFLIFLVNISFASSNIQVEFEQWKKKFEKQALINKISKKTLDKTIINVQYLAKVIEYDNFQPEVYEDTNTYINKRSTNKKIDKGVDYFNDNKDLIIEVEKKFQIEKELLLSLMGIETNFGAQLGQMDTLSALATLSFDKRRSAFFTNELLVLLKLIEEDKVDYKSLYGSWAGAFGFFQFMPSSINSYAIDYDNNNTIDLKSPSDAFASAANYLNKLGWNSNQPCFYKINLSEDIPKKFLNDSANNTINKKKLKFFMRYIKNNNDLAKIDQNFTAAIITPDKSIIANSEKLNPSYIVFSNYEIILKWNRSLRFALAVCTLKDKFENEL